MPRRFIEVIEPLLTLVPSVPRPRVAVGMGGRLMWTFLAVTVYLLMSITPLYGVTTTLFTTPAIALVLGISSGTLTQLGITPLVIAGIILEILVFSNLLDVDIEDPEDQARFNGLLKLLALAIGAGEASVLVLSGQLVVPNPLLGLGVVIQLVLATLIIILMDDMVSKGWGLGSGISLFILVSIVKQVFAEVFTPYTLTSTSGVSLPYGIVPALAISIYYSLSGDLSYLSSIIYRIGEPSLVGLVATVSLALIILYVELMEVSIPVTMAQYRGYRFSIPLKLMYVSVLPIIFTAYTVYLVGNALQYLWLTYNRDNSNALLNAIACGEIINNQFVPCPNSLLYFFHVIPPNIGPTYVVVHVLTYVALSTLFAIAWVNLAGLSAEDQAKYIVRGGLQIPGFRPSPRVVAKFLERYVRMLTLISGVLAGLIAAVGDVLGVYGGGIGLILMVEIVIQYYSLALREQMFEIYPALKRFIGKS